MKKKLGILLSILLLAFVSGCGEGKSNHKDNASSSLTGSSTTSSSVSTSSSEGSSDSSSSTEFQDCGFCHSKAAPVTYPATLDAYTPTTFNLEGYTKTLNLSVAPGVDLYKVEYNLNTITAAQGNHITVYVTEVDLNLVSIVAGSYNNTTDPGNYTQTSKIIDQVNAWKKVNRGKTVYMATNADYFGNSQSINAFVKDGVILKSGHNYDRNDLPESSPMLLGISGNQAQIAAMTKSQDRYENVDAKLTYGVDIYNADTSVETYEIEKDGAINDISVNWLTKGNVRVSNHTVLELTQDSTEGKMVKAYVTNKFEVTSAQTFTPTLKVTYLVLPSDFRDVEVNTPIAVGFIKSKDNLWNYYDTILGGRHSLVEQGNIAPTVSKETSNGAKSRVPRTAVGIKNDGTVMIVSVEDLEYNASKNPAGNLNSGVNLVELSDFMRYYGAYNAFNFDGGGSTQLLVNNNGFMTVMVRSSDYGAAYTDTNCRNVINTIMVVSK